MFFAVAMLLSCRKHLFADFSRSPGRPYLWGLRYRRLPLHALLSLFLGLRRHFHVSQGGLQTVSDSDSELLGITSAV
ncbi:hypothetical protein C8J57DRAFT_1320885 [Mycena rebaudengoi]|nr:hypothetical protein C8J57DRAFT_1320885 [Mycena rebaudengoi]